ncbi:MAG: hypothetical protein ACMUHY_00530 [Thermoplasmatota archaeon]
MTDDRPECVEMLSSSLARGIAGGVFLILLVASACPLLVAASPQENPTICSQLSIEVTSPPDSNPAKIRVGIPWRNGEPLISGVWTRNSTSGWLEMVDWASNYSRSQNISHISFEADLRWGVAEEITARVDDGMGSSSYVGTIAICSRRPTVKLQTILDTGTAPTEGWNEFRASVMDPDGQDTRISWSIDGEEVSTDYEVRAYLLRGEHQIRVEAFDGQWVSVDQMNMTVHPPDQIRSEGEWDLMKVSSILFLMFAVLVLLTFLGYAASVYVRERNWREASSIGDLEQKMDVALQYCEVCMGEVRESQDKVRCRCGATMHRGCGRREGVCPGCGREVLI